MKDKLNLRGFFKRLWSDFSAATVLTVVIAALLYAMDWCSLGSNEAPAWMQQAMKCCVGGLFLGVTGSMVSRYYGKMKWLCWPFAAVGCGLSLLLAQNAPNAWAGILIAAACMCLHIGIGRQHTQKRLSQICGCFLSSAGLACCLFAALLLCSYAVSALFLAEGSNVGGQLMTLSALVSYVVAAPWLFLGRLPAEEDDPNDRTAFRKCFAHLFLPIYLVLAGILLAYIALIIVRWEMPVGRMNGLGLIAMSLYALFTLALNGDENRFCRLFKRFGAWLMLPVLVVQQTGVWIRVQAYGLTPLRYIGLWITLLLALTVVCGVFGKKPRLFFVGAAVVALVVFASPINMYDVPRMDQEMRLKNALEACDMLDENGTIIPNPQADEVQKARILSAADYLSHQKNVPENSFAHTYQTQMYTEGMYRSHMEIFGFDKVEEDWTYMVARGTDNSERVNVAGFSYAEWYGGYAELTEQTESNSSPVTAAQLLAAADWEQEVLLQQDFLLEDGRTFRVAELLYSQYGSKEGSLYVAGWLLTPEE